MLIEADEHFDLPANRVYPYFRTPKDWTRLCGASVLERLFLERRFRRVWASGWRRLRREAERIVTDPPRSV